MNKLIRRFVTIIVISCAVACSLPPSQRQEPVNPKPDRERKAASRSLRPDPAPSQPATQATPETVSTGTIENAFKNKSTSLAVVETGVVSRILADDSDGDRHQRFILTLSSRHTVLIAHNIDIAPRIADIYEGDQITFSGQYEWNDKGGVVHWTHHDPSGRHLNGYLQHNGRIYQ